MPILDHFGILAPYYDRVIGVKQADQLVSLARLPVDGLLLDAGGGTGRVAQALQGHVRRVVIADVSLGMLHQARSKGGLALSCGLTERLPFEAACFERIIMVDALHHVADHAQTARELWRVLKPGGVIVVEEPDIARPAVKLIAVFEKLALMRSHIIPPAAIATLFQFPKAQTSIHIDGFSARVVVEKVAA